MPGSGVQGAQPLSLPSGCHGLREDGGSQRRQMQPVLRQRWGHGLWEYMSVGGSWRGVQVNDVSRDLSGSIRSLPLPALVAVPIPGFVAAPLEFLPR